MQFSWFAFYDANALVGFSRLFLYLLSIVLLFLYHQCFENTLWLVDVESVQNASRKKITLSGGTQRQCSSKPLKHSIVKRILVLKREI